MNTRHSHPIGFALVLLLCLAILASGCSIYGNPPAVNETSRGQFLMKIEVDHSSAKVGEPVHIRLTTTNDGQQPYVVESKDRPVLDIVVKEVNSDKISFSWAAQNPDKVLNHIEWKPGESIVIETVWIPPQEENGELQHLAGFLSINSEVVQSAGILFQVGAPGIR